MIFFQNCENVSLNSPYYPPSSDFNQQFEQIIMKKPEIMLQNNLETFSSEYEDNSLEREQEKIQQLHENKMLETKRINQFKEQIPQNTMNQDCNEFNLKDMAFFNNKKKKFKPEQIEEDKIENNEKKMSAMEKALLNFKPKRNRKGIQKKSKNIRLKKFKPLQLI